MNEQVIKNILLFLDRVQVTGRESIAWCEAVSALSAALNPPAPTVQSLEPPVTAE